MLCAVFTAARLPGGLHNTAAFYGLSVFYGSMMAVAMRRNSK